MEPLNWKTLQRFRLSTHHKNQLAAKVAGLADLVRGGGFAELVARHFRRTDGACRDQRHDALEMRPIASDAWPQGDNIGAVRLGRLCAGGNEGRATARFQ